MKFRLVFWLACGLLLGIGLLALYRTNEQVRLLTSENQILRDQMEDPALPAPLLTEPSSGNGTTSGSSPEVEGMRRRAAEADELKIQLSAAQREAEHFKTELLRATSSPPVRGFAPGSEEDLDSYNGAAPVPGRVTPRDRIEAYRCANQMFTIGLAIEHYAEAHEGYGPENLMELAHQFSPMTLICPSTAPAVLTYRWETFPPDAITYEFSPRPRMDRYAIHLLCKRHVGILRGPGSTVGMEVKYVVRP